MVHTGRLLSQTETQKLEAFAHAVITKNSASNERLLEELRRFLKDLASPSPEPIPENSGVMLAEVDAALLGVKVLVAEDDMRTAYSLSALLGGKGADVLVAETGRETLALLTQHADVRVLLLDMMMPEIDGFEVLRNLRQEGRFQGLPVLALSARETGGEREQCLAAGASEFLSKPVDNVRLLATLRDLLEPRTGDAAHA
jgi:CheY-like chemotaxis protein